mmetsp:Transcript_32030/g.102802  ORF Transcript_32030/g.102802 Transcript_32030/m.102802 type:complete len:277 (+) Transcript_32030:771-1601(+)
MRAIIAGVSVKATVAAFASGCSHPAAAAVAAELSASVGCCRRVERPSRCIAARSSPRRCAQKSAAESTPLPTTDWYRRRSSGSEERCRSAAASSAALSPAGGAAPPAPPPPPPPPPPPDFLSRLSQKVESSSAVALMPMSLLTKTSKASFIALWKMLCPWKHPFSGPDPTSSVYLSWMSSSSCTYGIRSPSALTDCFLTSARPTSVMCLRTMFAIGGSPVGMREKRRNIRDRSSVLLSSSSFSQPECSFSSSCCSGFCSSCSSHTLSSFSSVEECR